MYKIGVALLVIAVVLVGVGYVTFTEVRGSVEADAEGTLTNAAEREATSVENFIDDRKNDAVRISSDERNLPALDDSEQREVLRDELAGSPGSVRAIHYVDLAEKEIVSSSEGAMIGRSVTEDDRPWAVDPSTFAGPSDVRSFQTYQDPINLDDLIGFTSPVVGQEDHAVVVVVDLTARSQLLSSPVEGGTIDVISQDSGAVILSEEYNSLDENVLTEELEFLTRSVVETRIDEVETDMERIDEEELIVATAPVDGERWAVTAIVPRSTVFGTVDDVTRSLFILVGTALLGLVGVGALITRDINKSLDQMTEYAEEIESGNLDVEIEQNRTDEFGDLSMLFVRIRDTLNEQLTTVEQKATQAEQSRKDAKQAQREAQTAREEAEQLSSHLEEKAEEYLAGIEAAADGDLSQRLDTESQSQAMSDIGEAVNEMLSDIEQLVVQIQTLADEVDRQSSEVTDSTGEIRRSSSEVADSIEEISAGADEQSGKLEQAAAEMNDLSATVEEIASSSQEVAERSMEAAREGKQSMETASETVDQMEEIETKAAATADEMKGLQNEVRRISEIVELIDEIAEQTNMLALNASIEAARAGEAGEGFAVVASEIKSLAEETANATQEVENLVSTVEDSTESVADDMFEMQDEIEGGRHSVNETVETLESIAEQIEEANDGIQSINDATDEQANSTQRVVTMVDEVSEVSGRTANEAQNVSAAAEEQTSAIEQISASADSLSERARKLGTLADQFETSVDIGGDELEGTTASDN